MNSRNGKFTKVTIKEYGSLCKHSGGIPLGYSCLAESTFDRLEQFVLENRGDSNVAEPLEMMKISSRRGIGKIITAKNHVGVIAMKDGTQIEILPKLYARDIESSDIQAKNIFIHMLRFVKDIPNKQYNPTSLRAEKNHLLDIFIRMFIEEAITLVKRGLKSDYRERIDNESFYKGKLQVTQQIKHNLVHKERFYVEYDEYSSDRAENRLIKTTMELLLRTSGDADIQRDLSGLLAAFDHVETSGNLERDWASISTDRSMQDYRTILDWCRLFLSGQSFTPFQGDNYAYALLFPMELIYERYVAALLKRVLAHPQIQIKTQDRTYRLFQNPARFQLKPDIVVQGPSGIVVLDTKWKLLTAATDYGISQSDMYQAYAYGKKYGAAIVYLLYPSTPQLSAIQQPIRYESGDGVEVRVVCLDLSLEKACVNALLRELLEAVNGYDR